MVTSDNVKEMARKLGKSSHGHPILFAEKVLNHLERCGELLRSNRAPVFRGWN